MLTSGLRTPSTLLNFNSEHTRSHLFQRRVEVVSWESHRWTIDGPFSLLKTAQNVALLAEINTSRTYQTRLSSPLDFVILRI